MIGFATAWRASESLRWAATHTSVKNEFGCLRGHVEAVKSPVEQVAPDFKGKFPQAGVQDGLQEGLVTDL
jgi:hypothetical protein